jgi:hypothetical protein
VLHNEPSGVVVLGTGYLGIGSRERLYLEEGFLLGFDITLPPPPPPDYSIAGAMAQSRYEAQLRSALAFALEAREARMLIEGSVYVPELFAAGRSLNIRSNLKSTNVRGLGCKGLFVLGVDIFQPGLRVTNATHRLKPGPKENIEHLDLPDSLDVQEAVKSFIKTSQPSDGKTFVGD